MISKIREAEVDRGGESLKVTDLERHWISVWKIKTGKDSS